MNQYPCINTVVRMQTSLPTARSLLLGVTIDVQVSACHTLTSNQNPEAAALGSGMKPSLPSMPRPRIPPHSVRAHTVARFLASSANAMSVRPVDRVSE